MSLEHHVFGEKNQHSIGVFAIYLYHANLIRLCDVTKPQLWLRP